MAEAHQCNLDALATAREIEEAGCTAALLARSTALRTESLVARPGIFLGHRGVGCLGSRLSHGGSHGAQTDCSRNDGHEGFDRGGGQ